MVWDAAYNGLRVAVGEWPGEYKRHDYVTGKEEIKFDNIHPFADGNGRVGRLAMNYFLIMHDHPAITIHEEDRKNYYTALEAWDSRQELDILKDFLREQTVKTGVQRKPLSE